MAAATHRRLYACDTHYPWQSPDDEIIAEGRVPIIDGNVPVPELPGLGITLNYDQLEKLKARYQNSPYRVRDDVAEMRKHVSPNWERRHW